MYGFVTLYIRDSYSMYMDLLLLTFKHANTK